MRKEVKVSGSRYSRGCCGRPTRRQSQMRIFSASTEARRHYWSHRQAAQTVLD